MDDWQPIGRTPNQVILYHPPSHALAVRASPADPISIRSIPGTPDAGPSRTASSVNLPVLAARNTSSGVVLGRRRPSAVIRRSGPPVQVPSSSDLCPYCYRPLSKDPDASAFPAAPTPSAHVSPVYTSDPSNTLIRPEYSTPTDPAPPPLRHIEPYFQILEQSVDGSRASTPVQEVDDDGRFVRESETPARGSTERRSVEGYYSRFFVEEKRLGMGAEGTVYLCQVSSFAPSFQQSLC